MTITLTLNPLIMIQICAVAQTFITAVLAIVPKDGKPPSEKAAVALVFFKTFGFSAAGVLGVLFLDTGIAWLAGTWGFSDWRFQLPSAVLLVVAGGQYIVAGLLKRGTWVSIAYLASVVVTMLLFMHWWVPTFVVMGSILEGGLPVVLGILIGLGAPVAAFQAFQVNQKSHLVTREQKLAWDVETRLAPFCNRWSNLVIWVLVVIQGILIFSGYSLLTFWVP
jgi:hypothetical protein